VDDIEGEICAGFAHGSSGIAYALSRLYSITGELRLLSYIKRAMESEVTADSLGALVNHSVLGKDHPARAVPWKSWCHGHTGIALARLAAFPLVDKLFQAHAIEAVLKRAAAAPDDEGPEAIDTLCCGETADIELLILGADVLGRRDLLHSAAVRASNIVSRSSVRGFSLSPVLPSDAFVPGLFNGLSGIGYELLRAYGRPCPSVLTWA
jgi:lantibiotic modifying enzyme